MTHAVPQPSPTHSVTVNSDCESSLNRFSIHNAAGDALWSGIMFSGPYQESAGDFDAALYEAWLATHLHIREILETRAIKVSLKIEAEWVLHGGQHDHSIKEHSATTIMLWRNGEKETHSGIGTGTSRATPQSARLGQGSPSCLVGRAQTA